jgi:hypothetical protein
MSARQRHWNAYTMAEGRRADAVLGRLAGEALEQARDVAAESCRIARNGAADADLRLTAIEDLLALARRGVPVRGLPEATSHLSRWLREVAADPWQRPVVRIRAMQFLLAGSVLGWWPAPLFKLEQLS